MVDGWVVCFEVGLVVAAITMIVQTTKIHILTEVGSI